MDNDKVNIIASNLTQAFYSGQVRREAFLEADGSELGSDQTDRSPNLSMNEVFDVHQAFCKMISEAAKIRSREKAWTDD
jgi:hypothetical protein